MPLPRHYEVSLNCRKSVEGQAQRAPFKESRQFYFGSLLNDSNTLLREWPHVPFEPGGQLVKHARYYWLVPAEGHLTR